jgi:ACS family hexuronate transporter-like MFS transporter
MSAVALQASRYRWWICGLLFIATTLNYIDRSVVGLAKGPFLTDRLHWDDKQYSYAVVAFQATYAFGYLLAGRFMDVVGVRIGYLLSVLFWSLSAAASGLFTGLTSFCVTRGALGLAEGGNFPAAIKTVSEWFPKKERAFATGLFNSGSNIGPILAPIIVPWLAIQWGWPSAFIVTGLLGLLWIGLWVTGYKKPSEHPRVNASELALIESDPPDPDIKVSWLSLTRYRATWAFVAGMALTAPFWWFYLYWGPDFFSKRFHLDMKNIGWPLVAVYVMADLGSIAGGWLSSSMIKRGHSVGKARKTALLICALCVIPVFFAADVPQQWLAVLILGLALAAHQGCSCNFYTLVSDTMPKYAVSSVVGMGGMAGSLVGMVFSLYVGDVLKKTQNYSPMMHLAPFAYLGAVGIIALLLPKVEPVQMRAAQ